MAEIASHPIPTQNNIVEPNFIKSPHFNDSSLKSNTESYSVNTVDDEIPTVDYSMFFSSDPHQTSLALQYLAQVCHEYGFFYLVNHGIPDKVLDNLFKGISKFFDPKTTDERKVYSKKGSMDKIRWGQNFSSGENREYIKVLTHPHRHIPPSPSIFGEVIDEYQKELRQVEFGLARAISKSLGFDEKFIENAFNLKSGFDVSAMNLYPPNHNSKSRMNLPEHTDPGFIISLVQDVDGGLQILSHQGKWINASIPHQAILIQLGDHLEILTNGKYKSHIHRVFVNNNTVERISVVTLHGPSLDKIVSPASQFVDEHHPKAYIGMTYKQSLHANGGDEIDVQSSLHQIRLLNV